MASTRSSGTITAAGDQRLAHEIYIVTGANSGIGFETARALTADGAHVILAVRDLAKGEAAAARLSGAGSTSVIELDLADLDQVEACAKSVLERHTKLTGLICNAGVMGGPMMLTAQGFERQMATNHLGHAALVSALWPLLDASAARVVVVSSGEARDGNLSPQTTPQQLLAPTPYSGKQAYRNSKQANLLFALELHRRSSKSGSKVNAVAAHPGAVATNLLAHQLDRAGRAGLAAISKVATSVLLPSAEAGARVIRVALDDQTPSGSFVAPSGLGQLRGQPKITAAYPSSNDQLTGERVWQLTEQVLGKPVVPSLVPTPPQ